MQVFTEKLRTTIDIAASPERTWAILADFAAYPEWNPFITAIAGTPRVGERLNVKIAPPGGAAMTFRPRVLAAEPDRELRWKGRVLAPGVFDGEHVFRIEPIGGGTRFHQGETFTGFLVPLVPASLYERTEAGFAAMNRALKARAEDTVGRR